MSLPGPALLSHLFLPGLSAQAIYKKLSLLTRRKGKQSHYVTLVLAKMLIEGLNSIPRHALAYYQIKGADTCLREQRACLAQNSCVTHPYRWMDTVRKLGFQPWFHTCGLHDLGQITQPF